MQPTRASTVVERPFENAYVVPGTRLVAGEYPGRYPGYPEGGTEERLGRVLDAGITVIVDLTAPEDEMHPYEETLRDVAEQRRRTTRPPAHPAGSPAARL